MKRGNGSEASSVLIGVSALIVARPCGPSSLIPKPGWRSSIRDGIGDSKDEGKFSPFAKSLFDALGPVSMSFVRIRFF